MQMQMIHLIFLSFSLHSDKVRREAQLQSADHDLYSLMYRHSDDKSPSCSWNVIFFAEIKFFCGQSACSRTTD